MGDHNTCPSCGGPSLWPALVQCHEADQNHIAALPDGTIVKVTGKSVSGDTDVDNGAADLDREYVVCFYVPADASTNDDPNGWGYYLLDRPGITYGGDSWSYPQHIEVVRTVEQQASRKPPSLEDVRKGVASAVISMYEPIDPSEVDYEGDHAMRVFGRTHDGLAVQFRVRVDQIEQVDE